MIVNIPDIDIHFDDVVKNRKAKSASHLLPPITETYNPGLDPNALANEEEDSATVLINVDQVKEALKSAGKDVEQFGSSRLPTSFEPPSRLVSRRILYVKLSTCRVHDQITSFSHLGLSWRVQGRF